MTHRRGQARRNCVCHKIVTNEMSECLCTWEGVLNVEIVHMYLYKTDDPLVRIA